MLHGLCRLLIEDSCCGAATVQRCNNTSLEVKSCQSRPAEVDRGRISVFKTRFPFALGIGAYSDVVSTANHLASSHSAYHSYSR